MSNMSSLSGFKALRAVSASNDTDLVAATIKFASKPSGAIELPTQTGILRVVFVGTNAADEAFTWKLWAYSGDDSTDSDLDGPAEYIANGTGVLGTAQTGNTNEFFADSLAIALQAWPTEVVLGDTGTNRVASLNFEGLESRHLLCVMTNTTSATVGAYVSWVYRV